MLAVNSSVYSESIRIVGVLILEGQILPKISVNTEL